jgi:hypothetical protein
MARLDASQIPWRKPWGPVTPEHARALALTFRREVCAGHVLFGKHVAAIGRRQDQDDFLFAILDDRYVLACIHFGFGRQPNSDPSRPETHLYESIAAWEERLAQDVLEFGE